MTVRTPGTAEPAGTCRPGTRVTGTRVGFGVGVAVGSGVGVAVALGVGVADGAAVGALGLTGDSEVFRATIKLVSVVKFGTPIPVVMS